MQLFHLIVDHRHLINRLDDFFSAIEEQTPWIGSISRDAIVHFLDLFVVARQNHVFDHGSDLDDDFPIVRAVQRYIDVVGVCVRLSPRYSHQFTEKTVEDTRNAKDAEKVAEDINSEVKTIPA